MKRRGRKRYLLLEVITPHRHREDALEAMGELEDLVRTLGGMVAVKDIQHRVKPHPSTYVGQGKLNKLVTFMVEQELDGVIVNAIVPAGQKFRMLRQLWQTGRDVVVWDRVDLILQVFDKHATSAEAKLQIELARLNHEGPKVYGLGKTLLSRQAGGIGTRGIGETNIEREKRILRDRKAAIRKQLSKLSKRKQRVVMRRSSLGMGPVALVGYTSAGKTTLFNRLTGKERMVSEHLFTTLDTVVGKMKYSEQNVPVIISDTIGFMRDLPPQLVEAFRSTLVESLSAELILHVVDATDRQREEKVRVVEMILGELGVEQPVWRVYNKVDLLTERERLDLPMKEAEVAMVVSAQRGDGLVELKRAIVTALS